MTELQKIATIQITDLHNWLTQTGHKLAHSSDTFWYNKRLNLWSKTPDERDGWTLGVPVVVDKNG